MQFDFATSARILFGQGTRQQIGPIIRGYGTRGLIVGGRNRDRLGWLESQLREHEIDHEYVAIPTEPTIEMVREGARLALDNRHRFVIGVGGGSAMDAAKAIAILATNSTEPLDYLEVVGKGEAFESPALPFIAVPTTAGTGAEVTRNAVISSPLHGVKASLRHTSMLAKVAIVDSELTLDLPPDVTAYTGVDALTQVIEPYVSIRANGFVDLLCREGMLRAREYLVRAFENGADAEARDSMSLTSLLSGLSLANAGLGVVHGFAAPLGGLLHAPHGAICAAVLPHGTAVNIQALRQRAPQSPSLSRYDEAARILTGNPHATATDLVTWLSELVRRLGLQGLANYGLTRDQIPELVRKAANASSMKANPIALTDAELSEVAERSLDTP